MSENPLINQGTKDLKSVELTLVNKFAPIGKAEEI